MYNLGYKIIEINPDGEPKFMFCGLDGSRSLTMGTWLVAERRMVKDGTTKTEYMSGFHVLPLDIEIAKNYVKRFTNREHKFLVHVLYKHASRKPTLRSQALLAKKIRINPEFLDGAIPLTEL